MKNSFNTFKAASILIAIALCFGMSRPVFVNATVGGSFGGSSSTDTNQDTTGSFGGNSSTDTNQDTSGSFGSDSSTDLRQDNSAPADTTPPVISGTPANISTSTDGTSVIINYTSPTATDAVSGTVLVTCVPASGSSFAIGTTVVTCTAKDAAGNTATSTFNVVVTQTTPSPVTPPTPPTPVTPPTPPVTPSYSGGGSYSGSFYGGGFSPVPLAVSIATTSATTSCPLLTSYLKLGSNNDGSQVTKLQIFLKDSQNLNVDINGIFDQKTDVAVRAFQTKYMSDIMGPWGATMASGFVYITTEKKINEIACNSPLTLNPAEISIIDAYKNTGVNAQNNTVVGVGSVNTGTSTLNASTTTFGPEIGSNTNGSSNTASVINASVLQRLWGFIKNLF